MNESAEMRLLRKGWQKGADGRFDPDLGKKKPPMSYKTWMALVDKMVWNLGGCSAFDLPDCTFADWHDQGMSVTSAARKCIRAAKNNEAY